jgi:hypothetical protein
VRHGKRPKLWPALLGIFSAVLVLAAVISLLVIDPGKHPLCRYASGSVTVEVDGPDCVPVFRFITDDSDRIWVKTSVSQGSVYSQLYKGSDVVRIYDHGEPAFARAISGYFQKAQWIVVAPSPAPT